MKNKKNKLETTIEFDSSLNEKYEMTTDLFKMKDSSKINKEIKVVEFKKVTNGSRNKTTRLF